MSCGAERELLEAVLEANLAIPAAGLAQMTWGNISGVDRERGVYVIKPSGVPYRELTVDLLVTVRLNDGQVAAGQLSPSVDSETHRALYRRFADIGAVGHTHSTYATAFAQAQQDIPVLGTTHADVFDGPIPCTRSLTTAECSQRYEEHTGDALVEAVLRTGKPAGAVGAALAASHGPFTWGQQPADAVMNAQACEAVAEMAALTLQINPHVVAPRHVLEHHFRRKHGPGATYGNAGFAASAYVHYIGKERNS
jgi:L-ribulose-5-phosphate 4-epimerase